MPTQGEFEYFKKIGEGGMRHATGKPWSDPDCGLYLMELGAMLGLMPEQGRLLDLGCGTGWTSLLFAQRGYDVVGQDLVGEAIEAGRRLKAEHGQTNLDFIQSDYESLAFREEFDIAVFFDCLHHSLDETKALASAFRALRPGGICITSEPGIGHARRSRAVIREFGTTERDMEPGRIARAARKCGFRSAKVYPHASYLYIALYRRKQSAALSRLFAIPGMRGLAALFAIVFYRHAAGIVVLQK